jgi:hypothetical protein
VPAEVYQPKKLYPSLTGAAKVPYVVPCASSFASGDQSVLLEAYSTFKRIL